MSSREEKVVVVSPVTMFRNEADGLFAASFSEMGLTGFGKTPDEARHSLKMVFRTFIRECREHGVLEKNLNRLGVDWEWKEKSDEAGLEYEDTDSLPNTEEQLQRIMESPTWRPGEDYHVAANSNLAMAA